MTPPAAAGSAAASPTAVPGWAPPSWAEQPLPLPCGPASPAEPCPHRAVCRWQGQAVAVLPSTAASTRAPIPIPGPSPSPAPLPSPSQPIPIPGPGPSPILILILLPSPAPTPSHPHPWPHIQPHPIPIPIAFHPQPSPTPTQALGALPPHRLAGQHEGCWWRWRGKASSPPKGTVTTRPGQASHPPPPAPSSAAKLQSQEAMSVRVWQDRRTGLALPTELFATGLKHVSPWEVNVAPAPLGVPAHIMRVRRSPDPIKATRIGRCLRPWQKAEAIAPRRMLQREAAGVKQSRVLRPMSRPTSCIPLRSQPRCPCPTGAPVGANPEAVGRKQLPPDPVCRSPASRPHQKKEHFPALAPSPNPAASFGWCQEKIQPACESLPARPGCSLPPLPWKPPYFSTRCRRRRSSPQLTVTNDLTGLGPVIFPAG